MNRKTISIFPLPISLESCRSHLRMGDDISQDDKIMIDLDGAVSIAEQYTNRDIRCKLIEIELHNCKENRLPVPTISVESIITSNGTALPSDSYKLKGNDYEALLIVNGHIGEALTVQIKVGYSADKLPGGIRSAILMLLGSLFDNESDVVVGRTVSELPISSKQLLELYKVSPYV